MRIRKSITEPFFMTSLMEDFLSSFGETDLSNKGNEVYNRNISENLPSTNIVETKGDYQYELSTPGFSKENIEINLDDTTLTIKGERVTENTNNDRDYLSKEFHSQKFSRSFNVPENIVLDEIYAKVENGITTLFLPKEKIGKTKKTKRGIEII